MLYTTHVALKLLFEGFILFLLFLLFDFLVLFFFFLSLLYYFIGSDVNGVNAELSDEISRVRID